MLSHYRAVDKTKRDSYHIRRENKINDKRDRMTSVGLQQKVIEDCNIDCSKRTIVSILR
jgi:hypothetical protein